MQGCPFDCIACHNPQTIPVRSAAARLVVPGELVAEVRAAEPFISGVTVSGGECTMQPAFVREVFSLVKGDAELARLTTFLDSNGHATDDVWDALLPVTDGVMLDLKALDPGLHERLTGVSNELVLASIRRTAAEGKLHEVRLLLIPGVNDDARALQQTAAWLVDLDPAISVRVIGFRRHGTRRAARAWSDATEPAVAAAAAVLEAAGLRQVKMI